jgi:hypothetical protein
MSNLLTRNEFRRSVFERDGYRCVNCGKEAADVHHIIERRLWSDGGYYLDNGASLCGDCHILAEQTILGVDELREKIGIRTILPEHFYSDSKYDKWGNPILSNGQRLKGELFYDVSVQKILQPVFYLFTNYVKYPRTYHVPWSKRGVVSDKYLTDMKSFEGRRVVVTEKVDGENTTMYHDHIHARSTRGVFGKNYGYLLDLWSRIRFDVPENWRLCGENMFLQHTVTYDSLPDFFLVFSLWNDKHQCLSWSETLEFVELMGLHTVPVLYEGLYDEDRLVELRPNGIDSEGWVVRLAESFSFANFKYSVAKYVSPNFVLPPEHWTRGKAVKNKLIGH